MFWVLLDASFVCCDELVAELSAIDIKAPGNINLITAVHLPNGYVLVCFTSQDGDWDSDNVIALAMA